MYLNLVKWPYNFLVWISQSFVVRVGGQSQEQVVAHCCQRSTAPGSQTRGLSTLNLIVKNIRKAIWIISVRDGAWGRGLMRVWRNSCVKQAAPVFKAELCCGLGPD